MDEKLKQNLSASHIWLRLIYMVFIGCALYLVLFLFWFMSLVQFLASLITGERLQKLTIFCDVVCQYINECTRFISFTSEHKPFPFSELPESSIGLDDVKDDESIKDKNDSL